MKRIDTMEQWEILAAAMREKGYKLWQMQYSWDNKEGFHARFWKPEKSDVEVVTFDKAVQDAIVRFNG